MKPVFTVLASALILAASGVSVPSGAWAQTVTESGLVDSLKPKVKTRSLKGDAGPSAEDKAFLNSLGTRGIKIVKKDREKLDEIVKKADLPKIDIQIQFDYDSASIRPSSLADVDTLGKALSSPDLASYRIVLNGHTDAKGSDEYNLRLSEARAQSVRDFLVKNYGIAGDRLISIGYGEERLKNVSDPEAAENRRVEVINLTLG